MHFLKFESNDFCFITLTPTHTHTHLKLVCAQTHIHVEYTHISLYYCTIKYLCCMLHYLFLIYIHTLTKFIKNKQANNATAIRCTLHKYPFLGIQTICIQLEKKFIFSSFLVEPPRFHPPLCLE